MPQIKGNRMKKLIFVISALVLLPHIAMADQQVHGYTKANGTYVQPYTRSSPNGTKADNYSTQGNVNPYTGQRGQVRDESNTPNTPNPNNPY
jgi:hypothetical protein